MPRDRNVRDRYVVHANLAYGFCPIQGPNFTYKQTISNCSLTIAPETNQISYPMARFLSTLLVAAASLVAGQTATCPNEVAIYNQQDRTMTASMSVYYLSPRI